MVDVDTAENYQHSKQNTSNGELPREAVYKIRPQIGYRAERFHYHIAGGNSRAAEAAFPAEDNPTEYRKHIVPFQTVSAGETMGRLADYRLLQRSAVYHHVEKTADY